MCEILSLSAQSAIKIFMNLRYDENRLVCVSSGCMHQGVQCMCIKTKVARCRGFSGFKRVFLSQWR